MSSRIVRWSGADGAVGAFARRLRAEHPGDVLDVDQPELTAALVEAGAAAGRRSLLMERGLMAVPPGDHVSAMARIDPFVDDPQRYAGPLVRAFPRDHADFDPEISDEEGARAALRAYLAGEVIGPFLAEGSFEARVDGEVVGGIVVSAMPPGDAQDGGPWVTEVFVDPAVQGRGVGWALFTASIDGLRAAGHDRLGLAVHVDNPAQRLYGRLGFETRSRWTRITI